MDAIFIPKHTVNDYKFWYRVYCGSKKQNNCNQRTGRWWIEKNIGNDRSKYKSDAIEFLKNQQFLQSELYQQLVCLNKWPETVINNTYKTSPNVWAYLYQVWTENRKGQQVILDATKGKNKKKGKGKKGGKNVTWGDGYQKGKDKKKDDNSHNKNSNTKAEDSDEDGSFDSDDGSEYSEDEEESASGGKVRNHNNRKRTAQSTSKDQPPRKRSKKGNDNGKQEIEVQNIALENAQKHVEKVRNKNTEFKSGKRQAVLGNNSYCLVYCPSFPESQRKRCKAIEKLLVDSTHNREPWKDGLGVRMLAMKGSIRGNHYVVIGDIKLFESNAQTLARGEFKDWWTNSRDTSHSYQLYIIHQDELYKAIMGWTGRIDNNVQPQNMKTWNKWDNYTGDISVNDLDQDLDALFNDNNNNKNSSILDVDELPDGTKNKDFSNQYWNTRNCNISTLTQDYNFIKKNEDQYWVRGSMIPLLYNKLNVVWQEELYEYFHILKTDHMNTICNRIKWNKLENEINSRTSSEKGNEMYVANKLITKFLKCHYGENATKPGGEWFDKYGLFWVFTDDTQCRKGKQTHWMATSIKFERTINRKKKNQKKDANLKDTITKIAWVAYDSFNGEIHKTKADYWKKMRIFLKYLFRIVLKSSASTITIPSKPKMIKFNPIQKNGYDCGLYYYFAF